MRQEARETNRDIRPNSWRSIQRADSTESYGIGRFCRHSVVWEHEVLHLGICHDWSSCNSAPRLWGRGENKPHAGTAHGDTGRDD